MGTTSIEHKGQQLEVVFHRTAPEIAEVMDEVVMLPPCNEIKEIYRDNRLVTNEYSKKDREEITKKIN